MYTPPGPGTPPWSRHPPPGADPLGADPLGADTPRADTPRSRCPLEQMPPRADTTPPGADTTPLSRHPPKQTPPPRSRPDIPSGNRHPPPFHRRACWEIRSTRGRYASYWNAILLTLCFCQVTSNHGRRHEEITWINLLLNRRPIYFNHLP